MSKYRDELVKLRDDQFELVAWMRRIGDYGAGAAQARRMAENQLKFFDLMLERVR